MKKLVLIGAGGFGREVATLVEVINSVKPAYELLGFLDDGPQYHDGMMINGYPWLGKHDWILNHKEDTVCTCTVGTPRIKGILQRELMEQGVTFETLIAKGSFISPHTEIGPGCVIYGWVSISVNCKLGAGVLLNQNVTVGHDTVIGDYTSVMPTTGVSGCCTIGKEVCIGGHVFITPGRKVGDNAKIAAGSIVFSNVKAGTTVLGNPAKRMKALE